MSMKAGLLPLLAVLGPGLLASPIRTPQVGAKQHRRPLNIQLGRGARSRRTSPSGTALAVMTSDEACDMKCEHLKHPPLCSKEVKMHTARPSWPQRLPETGLVSGPFVLQKCLIC